MRRWLKRTSREKRGSKRGDGDPIRGPGEGRAPGARGADAATHRVDAAADPEAPRAHDGALPRLGEAPGPRRARRSPARGLERQWHPPRGTGGGDGLRPRAPEGRRSPAHVANARCGCRVPQPVECVSNSGGGGFAVSLEAPCAHRDGARPAHAPARAVAHGPDVPAHRGHVVLPGQRDRCVQSLHRALGAAAPR